MNLHNGRSHPAPPVSFFTQSVLVMSLTAARSWLIENSLDGYFHLHTDPHQSEYLAEHWQAMAWLSGFSGSAGYLAFTGETAALWTDSRYHVQAEKQLNGEDFSLVKMGVPGQEVGVGEWFSQQLTGRARIGYDPRLLSHAQWKARKQEMEGAGFEWVPAPGLWEVIWDKRPPLPDQPVTEHGGGFPGQTRGEKITALRKNLGKASAVFLSTLDDIAWLLNLRGTDIAYNPLFMSYLLVLEEEVQLFVAKGKVSHSLQETLAKDQIHLHPYEAIFEALGEIPDHVSLWIDPQRCSQAALEALPAKVKPVQGELPTLLMKAKKPAHEQVMLRASQVRDGVAMCRFLAWLDREIGKQPITEESAAMRLSAFRARQPLFQGESFAPIPGYGPNGALPHYRVTPESNRELRPEGVFLIDSGGQYLDGTTDITRTVALGPVPKQARTDFTLVLKGHIALAEAVFPAGTQGVQLDALARQFLWQAGMNYGHGTGHGVGYFLNVHEGPCGISPKVAPQPALAPGMLLSNEPALYREGEYGIRIENLLLVQEKENTAFGRFLCFETVTLCPIDQRMLEPELLSDQELGWLNRYHERVREALSPGLSGEDLVWLEAATRPVGRG